MDTVLEERPPSPVAGRYDVIVCGGGPAGFLAAVAAARAGVRTLLLERYGILGGTATAGLMVEFGPIHDGRRVIVGGVSREFLDRLSAFGGVLERGGYTLSRSFDPESMIALCRQMVVESGADILLHSLVVGAVIEDRTVTGVVVESKSGREIFLGKVVIDATGDGDVAARAGADFQIGREGDGALQPVTLEVILGNVDDTRRLRDHRELIPRIREAAARGEWPIPSERIFSGKRIKKRGAPDDPTSAFFFMNATNCPGVDGTCARELTRAELETRSQVDALVAFLRKYAPGFEGCYLHRTAVQVGVRETRRITGDCVLTREDVLEARHFPDGVVPACGLAGALAAGRGCPLRELPVAELRGRLRAAGTVLDDD